MNKSNGYLFVFLIFVVLHSCTKRISSGQSAITINTSINSHDEYDFNVGLFVENEYAEISQQARHCDSSFLLKSTEGVITYIYKPLPNYVGNDTVLIKSVKHHDGDPAITQLRLITLQISVHN